MDLLARQDELQAEAEDVLAALELVPALSALGRPVRVGSSALGLMVRRDIDITVVVPKLDMAPVASLGATLANHPDVRTVQIRDDTGHWNTDPDYPDGLYLGVTYGQGWNLDVWFVDEPDRQPDLRHVATFPARLTAETRAAILRVKQDYPQYRSLELYEAVLDGGVRTVEEYLRWRESR
ncbi:hypothetical protein GCM10010492_19730 [Saccharothrix mutabilis subsp. mutabilis]|uniref:Uncharacterized protein n=1 Tax=Saccharothrix mutabilis subsp. mutabilis TaxID=66855 RepID=A0ABN0TH66_9PSEU